ncbi:Do family serine endopeptidase [Calditerrivibrio nitroreducens]|uniref:Protease Do n=1 Tax=Calditerrivibrio nitroreducens (strain DSM 19672 / NBRC 101217 / Yu37-1) TaxID=768670 RepID=E4THN9_CALNY|nr:Do family serine endopeptidase [Calditerrivibrio nitroreducens]ADR18864.1 protease Do [Calditerrivibrio nitroreducens DSM 19672]
MRYFSKIKILMVISMLLFNSFALAAANLPNFTEVVKITKESVVNINTTQTIKKKIPNFNFPFGFNPFGDFDIFNAPEQYQEYKSKALGSGFIISNDGYIVTNNHVIEKADEINVKLYNGKEYKAKKIGRDPLTDLALLKIDVENADLKPLKLGDSDSLEIGEWVVAIGNPFGLESSYTAGIISAKGRDLGEGPYDNFLQTDASINPGNSGGPLVNLKGEVIGINTAIIASGQGLGFAVPVNTLKNILPQLKKGIVKRGLLGVQNLQELSSEMIKELNLNIDHGVIINGVIQGEPADLAGIKVGDIITAIDGKPMKTPKDVINYIGNQLPGKIVNIEILRVSVDGKIERRTFNVKLSERKDLTQEDIESQPIVVTSLTEDEKKNLKLDYGVKVAEVKPGTNIHRAGVRKGEIILSINNQIINNEDEFYSIYGKIEKGKYVVLRLYSKKGYKTIGFTKDQ